MQCRQHSSVLWQGHIEDMVVHCSLPLHDQVEHHWYQHDCLELVLGLCQALAGIMTAATLVVAEHTAQGTFWCSAAEITYH